MSSLSSSPPAGWPIRLPDPPRWRSFWTRIFGLSGGGGGGVSGIGSHGRCGHRHRHRKGGGGGGRGESSGRRTAEGAGGGVDGIDPVCVPTTIPRRAVSILLSRLRDGAICSSPSSDPAGTPLFSSLPLLLSFSLYRARFTFLLLWFVVCTLFCLPRRWPWWWERVSCSGIEQLDRVGLASPEDWGPSEREVGVDPSHFLPP